ncbi:MAG: Rieske 2Fe-2S domain-containing protein [Vicinamibacterales bacterium]|nr:Rieske 2Fe-2S domain-containing protein [Vicinamibacterales bacterium]
MTVKPGATRSRLDPEPMPRRDVLGLLSLWSMATALLFATVGMFRLPKAAVLASPSKKFRVALPDTLAAGEPFVPPGRAVAIYRDPEGVYAISTICTHLGCIVHATTQGFECPCHGSGFTASGEVTRGPAPRALDWLQVSTSGGLVTVDEGVTVPSGTRVPV